MELRPQLGQSPFGRPLYLESATGPDASQGDVYALLEQPMATVTGALATPENWCDVLMLHLNVKYCRAHTRGGRAGLHVAIGKKHEQSAEDAYPVEFAFDQTSSAADYLAVDACLATAAAPAPDRFAQSLEVWFSSTEAYATQLHEVDRDTYLSMKRQERERQRMLDEQPLP